MRSLVGRRYSFAPAPSHEVYRNSLLHARVVGNIKLQRRVNEIHLRMNKKNIYI
jgi:hypothetical protein